MDWSFIPNAYTQLQYLLFTNKYFDLGVKR